MQLPFSKPFSWMYTSVLALGFAVVSSLPFAVSAYADEESLETADIDPAGLVRKMSAALKTLNYEGVFVHLRDNSISSLHILHASDSQGELERLTSLNGEAREVIRNNSLVTCIWPGTQSVVVSKSKTRDMLPQFDATLTTGNRYEFSLGKADRVANHNTHVVNVKPVDKHRYGYRFWIDQETNMLLRSMLLEWPDKVLEQVMFTDISYPKQIDYSLFEVSASEGQLSWLEPERVRATSGLPKVLAQTNDRIAFKELPMGYKKVSETYSPMMGDDKPVGHVMVTDGMASVSIYVEYIAKEHHKSSSLGLSSMGAINAFGMSREEALITAVGEVPVDTVRAIANAVQILQ